MVKDGSTGHALLLRQEVALRPIFSLECLLVAALCLWVQEEHQLVAVALRLVAALLSENDTAIARH